MTAGVSRGNSQGRCATVNRYHPCPVPTPHSPLHWTMVSDLSTNVGSTMRGCELSSIMAKAGPTSPKRPQPKASISQDRCLCSLKVPGPGVPQQRRQKKTYVKCLKILSNCKLTAHVFAAQTFPQGGADPERKLQNPMSPNHGSSLSGLFQEGLRAHILLVLREAGSRVS